MGCRLLGPSAAAGALLIFALLVGAVAAQTTRHVPAEFPTIGAALEASEPGDTILVGPGVYRESLAFTETKGDRVILRSSAGADSTTIAYGDSANANEAVVTLQRCSDLTRVTGFTIDGRDIARRGVLASSESQPALQDLVIVGCEFGVATHKGASPALERVSVIEARGAGLYVTGASAQVTSSRFAGGARLGIYIELPSAPLRFQSVEVSDNGHSGLQATGGELSFENGQVARNGDSGIVLRQTAGSVRATTIDAHPNVGVVMVSSSVTLDGCTITNNGYGAVASGTGAPAIQKCTFRDNTSCHLAVEAEANPLIGGSAENANRFLGVTTPRVRTASSAAVIATHNFWDDPCAPAELFLVQGEGALTTTPWVSADLRREFQDCAAADSAGISRDP